MNELQTKWEAYRKTRTGNYSFRSRTRYKGVYDALVSLGLKDGNSILDLGAGDCHFGRFCYESGWRGTYQPIDATIQGTDLEQWSGIMPKFQTEPWDWIVAIEVAEHLLDPLRFIRAMIGSARKGVIITTPNPRVVNVLDCDPTHVSVISSEQLESLGFTVEERS